MPLLYIVFDVHNLHHNKHSLLCRQLCMDILTSVSAFELDPIVNSEDVFSDSSIVEGLRFL